MELSKKDIEIFINAILNPPLPNEKLFSAVKEYQDFLKEDKDFKIAVGRMMAKFIIEIKKDNEFSDFLVKEYNKEDKSSEDFVYLERMVKILKEFKEKKSGGSYQDLLTYKRGRSKH